MVGDGREKFNFQCTISGHCYFNRYSDINQTAGAIGGAASSIVRVPTEVVNLNLCITIYYLLSSCACYHFISSQVVKQRMQTAQFASAPDAVRLILAKEGFKGLYAVHHIHPYLFLISPSESSFQCEVCLV